MKKLSKIITPILVYISRFGFLPANISPLGSFGFFGGNFFLYFLTIVAFDFTKGGFYSGFIFTYVGFAMYWLLGKLAKTQKSKLLLLPIASFSFFLVSNFGVWLYWYPHTLSGLVTCYTLAIPFYKSTLMGDLFFGYGFMGYKLIVKLLSKKNQSNFVVDSI
jgi:hypothetical protein